MVVNTGWEPTNGVMAQLIRESGWRIRFSEQVCIRGWMAEAILGNGKITIWKEWEYTNGVMADRMKENTLMIRNMVMVFTDGLMVELMLDIGT